MISSLLLLLALLPLFFAFHSVCCLLLNYRVARKIGVPVIIIPVSPDNPLWMLISGHVLGAIRLIFGEIQMTRYGRLGWEFYDKYRIHLRFGDAVVLVTPGKNWLYVCNSETFTDIFQRRNDFYRPSEMLGKGMLMASEPTLTFAVAMLDVFGPNISTAHGADWQRQRKVTSAPFNEQNSSLVWIEALRQSQEVLEHWKSLEIPIRRIAKDTRTLSLHVLSGAGFGKSYSFYKSAEAPEPGHQFNYRDSLAIILENILLILIFGPKFLKQKYLPKSWIRIGQATVDFKFHMTKMVDEEKSLIAQGKGKGGNIINSLIRASEEISNSTAAPEVDARSLRGLTEEEIYGNIFVYNFAGHDTMAITLNSALYLLAANPEVQDWISKEINAVLTDDRRSTWTYDEVFPQLNRCLAVLLETLRLWDPLIGIAKRSGNTATKLTINDKEINIPPDTRVIPNINAIHSHPRYWGPDSLIWRPSRWVLASPPVSPSPTDIAVSPKIDPKSGFPREFLHTPPKGTYVPWSEGARVCPGKKFGQVEFVASIATLFRRHRLEVVPERGESSQAARERALAAVWDSAIVLLLQMRRPESVGLRWVETGKT